MESVRFNPFEISPGIKHKQRDSQLKNGVPFVAVILLVLAAAFTFDPDRFTQPKYLYPLLGLTVLLVVALLNHFVIRSEEDARTVTVYTGSYDAEKVCLKPLNEEARCYPFETIEVIYRKPEYMELYYGKRKSFLIAKEAFANDEMEADFISRISGALVYINGKLIVEPKSRIA